MSNFLPAGLKQEGLHIWKHWQSWNCICTCNHVTVMWSPTSC